MFKKFLFSALLVVTLINPFTNQVLAYSNSVSHYSFDLPNDWEEIPKLAIDNYTDKVVKQTNGKRIEFISGFQLVGNEHFKYPYILVQEHEVNTPSYSQMEEMFSNNKFQGTVDRKTLEYSELLNNATADKPFIDKKHNIIFMNIQLDVANIGQVNGLIAMFLGRNSITQLNFYSTKNEYSKQRPVFDSIIDSFRYDDGYRYDQVEVKDDDFSSIFNGVLEKGIGGVMVGGFLGLLAVLIGWFIRKKNKGEKISK